MLTAECTCLLEKNALSDCFFETYLKIDLRPSLASRRAQAPDLLDLKDLIRFNPASSKGAYNPPTSRDQSI